jgi:hypothetical protein
LQPPPYNPKMEAAESPKRRYLPRYTVSADRDLNIHGHEKIQLSYRRSQMPLKRRSSSYAVTSNRATTRRTNITCKNIPCCRMSSAFTSKDMKSTVVHKMCLQVCPRRTPFIITTIFLNTVHLTFYTTHITTHS